MASAIIGYGTAKKWRGLQLAEGYSYPSVIGDLLWRYIANNPNNLNEAITKIKMEISPLFIPYTSLTNSDVAFGGSISWAYIINPNNKTMIILKSVPNSKIPVNNWIKVDEYDLTKSAPKWFKVKELREYIENYVKQKQKTKA